MDGRITEAADLLRKASDMLLESQGTVSSSPASTASTLSAATHSRPNIREVGNAVRSVSVTETLGRARSMMQSSASGGLFRRLNQRERLRASSGIPKGKKGKKAEQIKERPFEFALLNCTKEDSDDEEDDNLRREMIVERGIVTLGEQDNEVTVREKLVSSLKDKYGMIGPSDFQFVKVAQKKISVLHLSKGTEYSYEIVKKLVGQGLLYIRMKKHFQFVIDENTSEDCDLDPPQILPTSTSTAAPTCTRVLSTPVESLSTSVVTFAPSTLLSLPNTVQWDSDPTGINQPPPIHSLLEEKEVPSDFFSTVVNEFPSSISEPTEMLRYLQKKIVTGRPLEVTDPTSSLEGETNFITVDRHNILKTTFEELSDVTDPRVTFEIQFYGEVAVDSGGPRKEWLRLCNQNIKLKYFDNGLKEHLSEDYFYVGQIMCISLLQNGPLPTYIPEEILEAIFADKGQQLLSSCVSELKRGMDTLGIPMFGRKYPMFLYLLRPSHSSDSAKLSVRKLLFLLEAEFSEEGSNSRPYENAVYAMFVKYVREASSGRRVVNLENILEFVTGVSDEPPLGFGMGPHLEFVEPTVHEPKSSEEEVMFVTAQCRFLDKNSVLKGLCHHE